MQPGRPVEPVEKALRSAEHVEHARFARVERLNVPHGKLTKPAVEPAAGSRVRHLGGPALRWLDDAHDGPQVPAMGQD
jgi:hypothetical protein